MTVRAWGYGRRYRAAEAALFAAGAPLAGLGLAVGSAALGVHGPDLLVGNWAGRLLLFIVMMIGYSLVLFTQLRYWNLLVFFGAFFTLFLGVNLTATALEDQAMLARGRTTACTVRDVDRREVTSTDSDGHTTTRVYYDHRLECAEPRVRKMTRGRPAGAVGDRVEVVYDPRGRLSPRPAGSVGDPSGTLKWGAGLFGAGVLLRVLYELDVPPFGSFDGRRFSRLRGALRRRRRRRRENRANRAVRGRRPSP